MRLVVSVIMVMPMVVIVVVSMIMVVFVNAIGGRYVVVTAGFNDDSSLRTEAVEHHKVRFVSAPIAWARGVDVRMHVRPHQRCYFNVLAAHVLHIGQDGDACHHLQCCSAAMAVERATLDTNQ